jgi:hypothetical protein
MSTVSRDIALNVAASIQAYQREMQKMEGVTAKEAKRAALKMQQEFVKAEAAAGKSGAKAGSSFAEGFKNTAKIGAVIAAVGAGFVAAQQQIADFRNQLIDAETRTGIAATTLAGLKLAAEGSGLGFEVLEASLNQWPKRMADVAAGTGESKKALDALGISVVDTEGNLRSADAVFRETLNAIGDLEDPTTRAAVATQAFGDAGGKLLQALGDPAALDTFIAAAEKYGVDIGPKAAAESAAWQREMALLQMTFKGGAVDLLDFGSNATTMFRAVGSTWVFTVDLIKSTIAEIIERYKVFFGAFSKLADGDFKGALYDMTTGFRLLGDGTMPKLIEQAQMAGAEYLAFADKMALVTGATTKGTQAFQANTEALAKNNEEAAKDEKARQAAALRHQEEVRKGLADYASERQRLVQYELAAEQRLADYRQANNEAAIRGTTDLLGATSDLAALARENADENAKGVKALFALEKSAAVAAIVINTAVAVTKALAQLGPIAGAAATAGIVAVGGAQTAAVLAQKLPEAHMGEPASRKRFAPDEEMRVITKHEEVLTRSQQRTMAGAGGAVTVVLDGRVLDVLNGRSAQRTGQPARANKRVGHRLRE